MIVLSSQLPAAIQTNLVASGIPADAAIRAANIPPTGALFASFLGYNPINPINTLLGPDTLSALPAAVSANVTGTHYFPTVIGTPFADALHMVFWLSALLVFLYSPRPYSPSCGVGATYTPRSRRLTSSSPRVGRRLRPSTWSREQNNAATYRAPRKLTS